MEIELLAGECDCVAVEVGEVCWRLELHSSVVRHVGGLEDCGGVFWGLIDLRDGGM